MTAKFTYESENEIYVFLLRNLYDGAVEYTLGDNTTLILEGVEFSGDSLFEKILELTKAKCTLKEFKRSLTVISTKNGADDLINAVYYFNVLQDAVKNATLKNIDYLKTEDEKYKDTDFEFYLIEIKSGKIVEIAPVEGMDEIYKEKVSFAPEGSDV